LSRRRRGVTSFLVQSLIGLGESLQNWVDALAAFSGQRESKSTDTFELIRRIREGKD
jgi:hypothetical protein